MSDVHLYGHAIVVSLQNYTLLNYQLSHPGVLALDDLDRMAVGVMGSLRTADHARLGVRLGLATMSQTKVAAAAQLPPITSSSRGFVETDTESSGSNDIWYVTSLCIITGVAQLLCDRRPRYVLTLASIAFFGIEGTEEERVEFGHTSKQ